jgi:CBS domain-containing protein
MENLYHTLPTAPLPADADLLRPDRRTHHTLTMDSPALEVMTDLNMVQPVTILADSSLNDAHALMVRSGIRLLFVTDDTGYLLGLVTANDVLGERPLQCMREQGKRRSDLLARDVMTPRSALDTLSLDDVRVAKVGHMLATMKQLGRQHALVVDQDELCGLFSTSQIARRLGVSLNFIPMPHTFSEIHHSLLHEA